MKSQTVIPVILSILIIILVAILERHSRFFAAITATMPLGAPLALWIVYASVQGDQEAVSGFSLNMFLGFLPTMAFMLVVWIVARAGWKLGPMILSGYGAWGVGLLILVAVKRLVGLS
jgi:hypothetical protein